MSTQGQGERVLLTGATGFLGGYLALYLLKATDATLLCLARDRTGLPAAERVSQRLKLLLQGDLARDERFNVPADTIKRRVVVIRGDVQEPDLGIPPGERLALGLDAIWHCAADVDFAENRRRQVMATNHQGTLNVLALLRRLASNGREPEFNYVSTAYVCGDRGGVIPEAPADLCYPVNNPYEESKRLCEQAILRAHGETGMRYRIFRPAVIVGHSRTLEIDSASGLYAYLSVMLRLKDTISLRMPEYFDHHSLRLLCDDDVTLNLVCVDQVTEAMGRIVSRGDASANRIYQIANPDPPLISHYLKTVTRTFGIHVEHVTRREALNPVDSLMNNQTDIYGAYMRRAKCFADDATLRFSGMQSGQFRLSEETLRRLAQGIYDRFNEDKRIQRMRQRSVTQLLSRRILHRSGQDPLNYYVGGQGDQTLVIVNAYGQSLAFWDLLVSHLVQHYRVVIWQVRGTLSQTGGVGCVHPIADHVEDMRGVLDSCDIATAHLIGWCTGPKTALEFNAAHPGRLASMTFLTGCFIHDPALKSLYTAYENDMEMLCRMVDERPEIAAQLSDILKSVLVGKSEITAAQAADPTHHGPLVERVLGLIERDIKPLVLEPFLTPQSIVSYARQLLAFWRHDIAPLLPVVDVPVLFVAGELDNIASSLLSREVSFRVPGAVYAHVQGGSHYMQLDHHRLIADIVTGFVRTSELGVKFEFPHGLVRLAHSPAIAPAADRSPGDGHASSTVRGMSKRAHSRCANVADCIEGSAGRGEFAVTTREQTR